MWAEELRKTVKSTGWRPAELARFLGVPLSTFSTWFNKGREPCEPRLSQARDRLRWLRARLSVEGGSIGHYSPRDRVNYVLRLKQRYECGD
jgi:transcriptional regulator with XRE-family HTH domain